MFTILVTFLTVIADQITKYFVCINMDLGETIPVIKNVVHLTYIINPGAAFGLFPHQDVLFLGIVMILLLAFAWLRDRIPQKPVYFPLSVADEGKRLDQFLKERTGLTRSEVQKWIKAGNVSLLPKKMIHSNYHVSEGDRISFFWEEKKKQELIGQNIPLDILYEDNDMIVINKRRGVVVHPGAGNTEGTLVNALLFHCGEQLRSVGDPERPGIVHRLDKDTSGVMVAAKSERAYGILQKEIASHKAQRCYIALVHGQMEGDTGVIRLPLGRSTKDRMKWDVLHETGRPAVTHFHVIEYLPHYSWIECKLETGRTHQIRVHMAHIRHAVVNDPLYGWKKDHFPIKGQALHSHTLELCHPITGEAMHFEAPVPEDMINCLNLARKESML